VSTLDGVGAPPLVLSSTLEMGTSGFRRGTWTAVQFGIKDPLVHVSDDFSTDQVNFADLGDAEAVPDKRLRYAPWLVWLDGNQLLDSSGLPARLLRNASLSEFYFVVSARTGGAALDAHAASGLRLECMRHGGGADPRLSEWIVNWAGFRQPLMPPPFGRPPPPPVKTPGGGAARITPAPGSGSSAATMGAAALGAASAAAAFSATLALLSLAAAAAWHRSRRGTHVQPKEACAAADEEQQVMAPPPPPPPAPRASTTQRHEPAFHVFLSYRRVDWRLADAVQDKLRLAGLRVFKDVDGAMAGRPFDVELLRAVRSAPVFAPVVTLPSLQRMAGAAASPEADTSLAEWLAALYFRDAEELQPQARPVRLIHLLLVGTLAPRTRERTRAQWLSLRDDPAYAAALAALPHAVPAATVALVDSALRRTEGAPLPPRFAALTVRQIVCGCGDDEPPPRRLAGILSGAPFALECAEEDVGLYIGARYAPALLCGVSLTMHR
jgi:hypothetical protein